uniref:Adenylate kinase 7 isoform X2 n=1 Tax=Geotrypetes seraphini TaxID=260995 RepID=A0A6P8RS31_GEOSA|nr:adenylate kinase 7 isoform X2 [Geotrypetes seraphini]
MGVAVGGGAERAGACRLGGLVAQPSACGGFPWVCAWQLLQPALVCLATGSRSFPVHVNMSEEDDRIRSKRIFINHLDCYSSGNIGKYLSNCVVGSSLEEIEEEEEEMEDGSSTREDTFTNKPKGGTFQIVGTLSKLDNKQPDFSMEIYRFTDRDELLHHLLECDVIVYNISENSEQIDEASWAASALHTEIENFWGPKMFILISTVMTWSQSKLPDPDDPEIAFTEEDYRRRKAHSNFKDHVNAEKLIIKLGKTNKKKFVTYIVAAGLQYGAEEGVLHPFFKAAWLGEIPALPLYGEGFNIVPLIHVTDLAGVIQNIIDHKPRTHYLLGVDEAAHTLGEVIKCISKNLGPGKIERVPKENAFLSKDLTQADIEHLFVNLKMEAVFLKENFNIKWIAQTGLVENIAVVIKEYRQIRGLTPIKICVLGPPAVGKTTVSAKLCKHYKLHHVQIKEVITEAIAKLETITTISQEEEEEEEEEEETGDAAEILEAVRENMEQNAGQLDDQYVIRFMREKLKSMPCLNQGYVLDGYPKTYEQAKELFNNFVIFLDAPDEFLKHRVMNLPESVVVGTHYTQDRFLRTLMQFREANTDDETILNYFDELEIHPQNIDVSKDDDPKYADVANLIIQTVGNPHNYGLTPEDKEAMDRKAAEEHLALEEAEKAKRERRETEEAAEKIARWEEWSKRMEEVKRQERELLEAKSIPLRNYLMKNVMPTLIQGLSECCKIRPEDPVDFLAEYLFKYNPQIDEDM